MNYIDTHPKEVGEAIDQSFKEFTKDFVNVKEIGLGDKSMFETSTNDIKIIAIDESNGIDYTAISQICTNCNHVIEVKVYKPYNKLYGLRKFDKCPVCGMKFKEERSIKL